MPDKDKNLKLAFLESFKNKLLIADAIKDIGIKRQKVEAWKRNDPDFREELEMMELHIVDLVKKLALQKLGLIPTPNRDEFIRLKDRMDNSLIVAFLKREQINVNVNNHPQPMEIKGLSPEVVAKLSRPEARDQEPSPAIDMIGVPRNLKVKEDIEQTAPSTETPQ